ncbi:hypothetical protein [Nostoc parmelioides]|uniref:Uncharacterized protein n=1 Tax=Nostoc parmelioides FACHB-3921 TaxID=2692909 RepID=A0ABR8BRR6_9NOSO|nr:hypothetical protein [Nostoc parmelioides]MBD2255595.1 hypothetical protein [Nostoc parmelioides FACHB-3921]
MEEVVACFYSFSESQILVGGVDELGNLIITQGCLHRKIPISECAKLVIKISNYTHRIWINKHEPFKKALAKRGVEGEVDFSQEDVEAKDLFLSLKHTGKIKMCPNLEAIGSQFSLSSQILIRALLNPLTGVNRGSIPFDSVVYFNRYGEIDMQAELREALKEWDV